MGREVSIRWFHEKLLQTLDVVMDIVRIIRITVILKNLNKKINSETEFVAIETEPFLKYG